MAAHVHSQLSDTMGPYSPLMISPRFSANHWFALRFEVEADWGKAIEILQDRLNGRFIRFADQIVKDELSGFAVLTLDATLVETLQQFREGIVSTPRGQGEAAFVKFLTETEFGSSFTPELASRFYKDIRNGLLHQAETKEMTRVRRDGLTMVTVTADGQGMTIHPVMFHDKLKEVFDNYCNRLRNPTEAILRANFRRKMDAICNVRLARSHVHLY